jgi:capsular exopolysaccharide synthesis family protein
VELKSYLRILQEKWWIVLAAFVSTVAVTAVLTFARAPVYQATATYIVAPSGEYENVESLVGVLDAMSRRVEIAGTYTEIAASQEIKQQAADALGLSQTLRNNLHVESQLLPDTNVIEITVEGSNRELVQLFADSVGASTTAYVQGLYGAYGLRLLDGAEVLSDRTRSSRLTTLALGVLVGLALGVACALFSEYLDSSLRNAQDIEAVTALPTLAQIPISPRHGGELRFALDGDSAQREAFLRLRTRILANEPERLARTLLVTSAEAGAGKSTVVAHLATAMARSGRRVIVVDGNLRQPALHQFFGVSSDSGLCDVLMGQHSLDEVLQDTDVPGLQVLASGSPGSDCVVDLLDSCRMTDTVHHLAEEADLVLIDTPSVLSVADATALAPMTDYVLLVVGSAQVTEGGLRATCQQLTDINAKIAGVVINRVRINDGQYV